MKAIPNGRPFSMQPKFLSLEQSSTEFLLTSEVLQLKCVVAVEHLPEGSGTREQEQSCSENP